MISARSKKIRAKIKKDEIKRIKIGKIQKRIASLGFFGLASMLILLLFGYLKDPNQLVKSSFELNTSKNITELITHFLTNVPTIDGEIASSIKTTREGAWVTSSENNFFTLIEANFKTHEISYNIYQSEFGVKGSWIIQFSQKHGTTILNINEESLVNNLGQRALLYWKGNDIYCQNLFEAFNKSLLN